ncbi:MAG: hypothetical protein ABW217_16890 [Polyangiaceae bacterium]
MVCAFWLAACGGAHDAATKNRTFYDWSLGDGTQAFERGYPELNWPENAARPTHYGVSILEGGVRFSRPASWRIRNASSRPEEPFIHYVSPDGYSFAVYQRRDPPDDPWQAVLQRYEEDVTSVGAKVVGQRVPMAVYRGQGRAYTIERDVPAAKGPLKSRSREMVIRSPSRVVLVQIVFQEQNLQAVQGDLLRAMATMEVR